MVSPNSNRRHPFRLHGVHGYEAEDSAGGALEGGGGLGGGGGRGGGGGPGGGAPGEEESEPGGFDGGFLPGRIGLPSSSSYDLETTIPLLVVAKKILTRTRMVSPLGPL